MAGKVGAHSTGRPPGHPKSGGRKKGTPNRPRPDKALLDSGQNPLEYMLNVMRDPNADLARRDEMARASAPYCHAKLIAHTGASTLTVIIQDLTTKGRLGRENNVIDITSERLAAPSVPAKSV